MRDPVTLTSGITYDRESIEQWIFTNKHGTCPVTKQALPECDPTPNHTLRRLIQSWCAANAFRGIERIPTPRPPIEKAQISALLHAARLPNSHLASVKKLKKIVSESERNKRCVKAVSAVLDFLVSIISATSSDIEQGLAIEEAVSILNSLQLSQEELLDLLERNQCFLDSLIAILRSSFSYQSRSQAVLLIKSLVVALPVTRLISLGDEFFEEIVNVLKDRVSYKSTKTALKVLHDVCSLGRNMKNAVRAGAITVLIELLLDEPEKRACEMMMVALHELCGCEDGRAELVRHAAGLAVVSKKMLRVSIETTERAVMVVHLLLSSQEPTAEVIEEIMQVGVVSKLCLMLQVECGNRARKMAKEILNMHAQAWRRSPCLKIQFKDLYPLS